MSDTITRQSLLAAVYRFPRSQLPKMQLADWYEERGDSLRSDCWRELARRKHHYHIPIIENMARYWVVAKGVTYEDLGGRVVKEHSCLPLDWVGQIRDDDWFPSQAAAYFDSKEAYWHAVVEGYVAWKTDGGY